MALITMNAYMSGDCQAIIINLEGLSIVETYQMNVKHVDDTTAPLVGTVTPGTDTFSFNNLTKGGVYEVTLKSGNTVIVKKFVVSTCAVDKCLVLLTEKLLNCGCTSPACSAILQKAQKVMLLLKSAESTAARITAPEDYPLAGDAEAQYKKAVQMCDGNCDCGC